jgi:vanillate O-demethylase ferredoxin subunit
MHDTIVPGSRLTIGGPRSNFLLRWDASFHLLIAGGIGITPILSMARHLAAAGADFALHYCAASAARAAFLPLLERSSFHDRVYFHFDEEPGGGPADLDRLLAAPPSGTHLHMCGPAGLMNAVRQRTDASWPTGSVHWENFGAAPPVAAEDAPVDGDISFTIRLARSGQSVVVPVGVSIVTALAAAGISVEVSCEQGVCGTCLTRVLGGEPDHRDLILSDQERLANDQMTLCVSRSKTSTLTLDL